MVIGKCLRYLDTDTALIAESAPGLEEFVSTPALADVAAAVLAEHGFVDASADENSAEKDPKQFLCGTIATGDRFVTGDAMRNAAIEPRMPIASRWRRGNCAHRGQEWCRLPGAARYQR